MSYTSTLLQTLDGRGFIADGTDLDGLDKLLADEKNVPIYIGFDCTAPSLHVGSLIQIMTFKHIQEAGHKPIVLMGGATTKIGDPSGKDESRPQLDDTLIEANMNGIKEVFAKFLTFEGTFDASTNNAVMVNNDEWLVGKGYIEFLRDVGPHFSVNVMLAKESVKQRLSREAHMSFLEFNYMILQAYDFVELAKRYGCRAQFGGSDQWGNITAGSDLYRRLSAVKDDTKRQELYGVTTPLITTADGKKMGKTADGAMWLNEEMLSSYDYWQFWRNTQDGDVGRFLRLFTDLPLDEIASLEALEGAEINQAKIALANAATRLLHGEEAAKKAEATAADTFAGSGTSADLPTVEVSQAELDAGIPAFVLYQTAGLASSGGEARRLVKGGGAKVNDEPLSDAEATLDSSLLKDGAIKLSAGKKRHVLVKAS